MDISVLISTYRRDETLKPCLESLSRLEAPGVEWELILVDNAGMTATRELVQSYSDAIDLTYLVETTPGKNSALNSALGHARGSLYVFSDDDIVAAKDWLAEMWAGVKRWPAHAVFGGRILPMWPEGGKKLPLELDDAGVRAAFSLADWDDPEGPIDAARIWGPNMAVRAALFEEGLRFNTAVGPKGANYLMGSETELTKRLERDGYQAIYLPRPAVRHQIREEQLTAEWIYGRAFRAGRGLAYSSGYFPSAPRIFNVPRFLLRQAATVGLARLAAALSANRREKLKLGMKYWRLRGCIHQCYVSSKDNSC